MRQTRPPECCRSIGCGTKVEALNRKAASSLIISASIGSGKVAPLVEGYDTRTRRAAVLVGGGLYWRFHRTQALTEKDTIVLADFANSTGRCCFRWHVAESIRSQPRTVSLPECVSRDEAANTAADGALTGSADDQRTGTGNMSAQRYQGYAHRLYCQYRCPLRHRPRSFQCQHRRFDWGGRGTG
jgi:hypothetical protein